MNPTMVLFIHLLVALVLSPMALWCQQRQTKAGCPPPVGQFLVMRERPRRGLKRVGEEIARISVRENNYFGRTRCSIPEEIQDTAGGNVVGGSGTRPLNSILRIVEEELEEEQEEVDRRMPGRQQRRRSRLKSCTLYLTAADFAASRLEVRVLLLTELVPGLAAYCDTPLTAEAHIIVEFCHENNVNNRDPECAVQNPLPRDNRSGIGSK